MKSQTLGFNSLLSSSRTLHSGTVTSKPSFSNFLSSFFLFDFFDEYFSFKKYVNSTPKKGGLSATK